MSQPLRWRGYEITENASKELNCLYDIARYAKELALEINKHHPGIPENVPQEIKDECKLLVDQLVPYSTDAFISEP